MSTEQQKKYVVIVAFKPEPGRTEQSVFSYAQEDLSDVRFENGWLKLTFKDGVEYSAYPSDTIAAVYRKPAR